MERSFCCCCTRKNRNTEGGLDCGWSSTREMSGNQAKKVSQIRAEGQLAPGNQVEDDDDDGDVWLASPLAAAPHQPRTRRPQGPETGKNIDLYSC